MSQIIDTRDLSFGEDGADRGDAFLDAVNRVASEIGHDLTTESNKVNQFTGHPRELRAAGAPGFDNGGAASDTDYINQAREYVALVAGALGFAAGEPVEFEADPRVATTSEGIRVVSLQQTAYGIPVEGMAPKVLLFANGGVDRIVGDTVSVPADLPVKPAVPAEVALRVAAAKAAAPRTLRGNLGVDELQHLDISEGFERLSFQSRSDQPMTFSKGPFEEDIPARLVYLYMGGYFRLTWFFTFSRENLAVQYHAFVEADEQTQDLTAPEILLFSSANSSAIGGRVFRHNPDEGPFEQVDFPLPVGDYPVEPLALGLPAGFPLAWTEARNGKISTEGNNVRAVNGTSKKPYTIDVDTAGEVMFNAAEDTPEQYVTNIFFFCNYMHDFFMMLGFTEEHGNFQTTNVTGKGQGADPVQAFAHPGRVFGTANMATRADGVAGVMNMGLVTATGRHTANDADVVFHEFTHGVTNRLVGGMFDANGLREEQSVAMGEGWADFFALTIINFSRATERVVTGTWVTNQAQGIRQRPYDSAYPGAFGDIGKGAGQVKGAGQADLSYQEVHDVGEIWCAVLMELTRQVSAALTSKRKGYRVTWQAVVDGLKLTPKNPSFLVARDAILRAFKGMKGRQLSNADYAVVQSAAWETFAGFEMGFDASCPNASFVGCQGGKAVPPAGGED